MDSINCASENQEPEQPPEHDNNMAGIGRSYDCVYCKRGFNTAQALGGHMNIHRKDRAARNPKPNTTNNDSLFINPNKNVHTSILDAHEQTYVPIYYHHQVSTGGSNPPPPAAYHHHASHRTCFPASTSAPAVLANHRYYGDGGGGDNPQCLNFFGEDWRMSLSLEYIDDIEKKGRLGGSCEGDGDVDLELRLGHDR